MGEIISNLLAFTDLLSNTDNILIIALFLIILGLIVFFYENKSKFTIFLNSSRNRKIIGGVIFFIGIILVILNFILHPFELGTRNIKLEDGVRSDKTSEVLNIRCNNKEDSNCFTEDRNGIKEIRAIPRQRYTLRLQIPDDGVKATYALSKDYSEENYITGYISYAKSQQWDSVKFYSEDRFYIDYIEGSARLITANGSVEISDSIITSSGIKISMGGYLTIEVEPIFTDTNFIVENTVRIAGNIEPFLSEITAAIGEQVEFQIHYKNSTEASADNVAVLCTLPQSLRINSDVILYNSTTGKKGKKIGDITKKAQSIGGYSTNGEAYLRFTAEVVEDGLVIGTNRLRTYAVVKVGKYELQNYSDIVVELVAKTLN